MRCREVRQKLIETVDRDTGQPVDPELTAHIRDCARCARDARVVKLLETLAATARENDRSQMIPLARMRQLVEKRTAQVAPRPTADGELNERTNSPVRKSLAWAAAVAVMAVFLGLQVFIPDDAENNIVGYEVAFAGVERDLAEDTESICYLLWTLELPDADIDEVFCDTTCRLHIVYLQSPEEAARVIEAFSRMENAYRTAEIIPVRAHGTPNPAG